eukprot:4508427-Alexandrium_andersonii.AAC.1
MQAIHPEALRTAPPVGPGRPRAPGAARRPGSRRTPPAKRRGGRPSPCARCPHSPSRRGSRPGPARTAWAARAPAPGTLLELG